MRQERNKQIYKNPFMDLTSRLDGYLNHQIAYPNPIPSLPVPKTLHDKKDTTLLQMALKAFVKERLFGRFNIYERENKQNSNHLGKSSFSTAQNSRFIPSISQNNSKVKEAPRIQNNASMLSEMSQGYLTEHKKAKFIKARQQKEKQKSVLLEQRRLSQISSSFDFKPKGFTETKSLANSHAKLKSKDLVHLHQSFNLKHQQKNPENLDQEDHPRTSFISAIDYYEKPSAFSNDSPNDKFKLPEIIDKRKSVASKLELPKNTKTYGKKQTLPQVSVNDQLWLFLSKDNQQKLRRIRQIKTSEMKESIVSIPKSSDKIDQTKNTSMLRNTDGGLLSKDSFQTFLNNPKCSIPFFMLSIINFFQFMNKITDKFKRTDFEASFSNLFNLPDRAWCVAVFRFFDINTDGKIDSSDLFKIHNLLQDIIEKVQSSKMNSGNQNSFNQSVQFKQKTQKRQTTQNSQNQSYVKNDRQKTQTKNKQKTDESQKMSEESYQVLSNFKAKNIENLKSFQKYVQKLNQRFMQKDKSLSKNQDFYNPQNQSDYKTKNKQKNNSQIRYLEEALLKNKDLKVSDLSLILEEMTYQNSKTKKKVIDIDYKKMNIKLSSSYVQTFIATNHNEETRMNREHLQSLKDSLKGQEKTNGQISNIYDPKQLPCIKYAQFYEEKLFLPLKNMFFQCLYSDIIEAK